MSDSSTPTPDLVSRIRKLWEENGLGLNIPLIDLQHLWLVSLILQTEDRIKEKGGDVKCADVREILLELTDFITEHFDVEERLFIHFGYPLAGDHKDMHDGFIAVIQKRFEDCSRDQSGSAGDLMTYLHGWLFEHILKEDRAYQRYFAEKRWNTETAVQKLVANRQVTVRPEQAELYNRVLKPERIPEATNRDTVEKIYGIVSKFKLAINVPVIDIQHLWLLKLMLELDRATHTLAPSRKNLFFERTIALLTEYTREHFATEEMLMKEFQYPEYERHRQEHFRLIEIIQRRSREYRSGDTMSASNLAKDLKDWIFSHIAIEDRQLGNFLSVKQRQVSDFIKIQIQAKRLLLRHPQVRLYQQVHNIIVARKE